MRVFVFIALFLALAVGNSIDVAHAATPDHQCAHHQVEHNDHVDDEDCHSHTKNDQSQCDDCCCVHSHSMAISIISNQTPLATKQQNIIVSLKDHYSADLSGLKRPPRL